METERRIAHAARARSGVLDLSDLGLSAIPDTLGQLTELTELYLNGNQLTAIPTASPSGGVGRWESSPGWTRKSGSTG